jgi:hypothetical protein
VVDPLSNPDLRALPADAERLLLRTCASPRLLAHLVLVHDVAFRLAEQIRQAFPGVAFDLDAVRFGAATHDIGKVFHRKELVQPGKNHERQGVRLLLHLGVEKNRARFAYTHGNWATVEDVTLEDLIVALADMCWKGKRVDELEAKVSTLLSRTSGKPEWQCFADLDRIVTSLAAGADARLARQQEFGTESPTSVDASEESKQPSLEVTANDVERVVRRDFSTEDYAAVMAILAEYGTEAWHRFRPDVQLAALKLADGSMDRLRIGIEIARRDFRDVLFPAKFPGAKKAFGYLLALSTEEQRRIRDRDRQQFEEWLAKTG